MGRSPCCEKEGLKKGPWTPEEDQKLLAYIEQHGHGSWRALPAKAGLQRCGKSCRLRWTNYLRPDIKRGKFSLQEEQTIIQLHALLGNRWSAIATHLPKRTDNEIKNFWNTHLKRRLCKMGIDPVTHKPRCDAVSAAYGHASKTAANLSHMAQWESARLEAEARLVRESKLHSSSSVPIITATSGGGGGATSVTSASSSATAPFSLPPLSSATSTPPELHNALSSASSSDPVPPPFLIDANGAWQGEYWAKPTKVGPSGGAGQSARAGQIDLQESPTSPLSFCENFLSCSAAGRHGGIRGGDTGTGRGGDDQETDGRETLDWSGFPPAPMHLLASKDMRSAFPPTSPSLFGADLVSWLHEPLKAGQMSTSSAVVDGNFGDGFTEMLLDDSDDVVHNSSEEGRGCVTDFAAGGDDKASSGEGEEESKGYWNSLMNLVNSSTSASNSPAGI